jgi:hypothetical protein
MKRNVEKVWGARYTLDARYLSKNTVIYRSEIISIFMNLILSCDEPNGRFIFLQKLNLCSPSFGLYSFV